MLYSYDICFAIRPNAGILGIIPRVEHWMYETIHHAEGPTFDPVMSLQVSEDFTTDSCGDAPACCGCSVCWCRMVGYLDHRHSLRKRRFFPE